ncbi:MAG: L(+)-tartrate dehydratase subunit beta [Desulfurococcaceae archaeon]
MNEVVITTPIRDDNVLEKLRVGDIFYINGIVVTARDSAHRRVVVEGKQLPIDLRGLAVFHAGPVMKRVDDKWTCISIGPTTSRRMEYYEYEFMEKTGVKVIIGKGGMGQRTSEACKRFKAIYAIFPGGCGVLGADKVEEVERVEWIDLGIPEALWVLRVKMFGPLIVAIDTRGVNIAEKVVEDALSKKETLVNDVLKRLGKHIIQQ